MTNYGHFRQTTNEFEGLYYGAPYPQILVVEETRRSVDSSNSPRVNGKLRLVPNSLRYLNYRIKVPPNLVEYEFSGYPFRYHVEQVGNIGFYDQVLDEVEAQAASRFYSKVGELKFNIAQAFAERKMTYELVASTATQLAKMFLAIRRGKVPKSISLIPNFRQSNRFREYCGQKWLEYQYGWKPLLSDVYGAMVSTVDRAPRVRLKAVAKIDGERRTEEAVGQWIIERIHGLRAMSTVRCLIEVDSPGAVKLHELGLDNPALLAWELCPYSFVVDWFIPIGNWLESQTALTGLAVLEPQTTTTAECQTLLSVRVDPAAVLPQYRAGFHPTQGSGYKKSKRRDLKVPSVPLPTFQNPFSVTHALNAIALLGQAFFGRKTPWTK